MVITNYRIIFYNSGKEYNLKGYYKTFEELEKQVSNEMLLVSVQGINNFTIKI